MRRKTEVGHPDTYNTIYSRIRVVLQLSMLHSVIATAMSSTVRSSHAGLSKFSSCELSDALIKLGLPHGGHIPDIHMLSPSNPATRICGPAYTVKMVFGSDKTAPQLEKHFVDEATPNSVVVIDAPPRMALHVCRGYSLI